ncbi:MAG: hypothetical protein ABSF17_08310 [Terracidiphilus sp.]|jgi:hypothetical protein
MAKKKSKIELAREIIANLRLGMGKPPLDSAKRKTGMNASPRVTAQATAQLQTSHS